MEKIGRKLAQAGFLALFLYPLAPAIYRQLTFRPAPSLMSWLSPWDPLLFIGQIFRRDWAGMIIGAPLLLIGLTLIFGRFFCGWVCPLGTVLDFIRPLAGWRNRKQKNIGRPKNPGNSGARFYLLAAALAGSFLSLHLLRLFDPLVIFLRSATALTSNAFALRNPPLRAYFSIGWLMFLGILILELIQNRFWCRNLCPLGALFNLFSRKCLLERRVNSECSQCDACRRACTMNAIPEDATQTRYGECTFCLDCLSVCPKGGIAFGFRAPSDAFHPAGGDTLLEKEEPLPKERPLAINGGIFKIKLSRRRLITGTAAGVAGLALAPLAALNKKKSIIRPPGALPEEDFIRTCVICQECVRVCPTGALRPAAFQSGLGGLGTPQLVPRQGGCALNNSCPQLCAKACPVAAIRSVSPESFKIGLAKVDRNVCLAWDQGAKCLVCVEACPNDAAQMCGGRVIVDPRKCTGCGRCENSCPVAGSAIRVFPL